MLHLIDFWFLSTSVPVPYFQVINIIEVHNKLYFAIQYAVWKSYIEWVDLNWS